MMSFKEALNVCLKQKFATISGRATRAEYWWFQLFVWLSTYIIIFICCILENVFGSESSETLSIIIYLMFMVVITIPNFCVCVRRLHDRGHSAGMFGWCILGVGIGLLIINIINLLPSVSDNEYGPNPNMSVHEDASATISNTQKPKEL